MILITIMITMVMVAVICNLLDNGYDGSDVDNDDADMRIV